MDTSLQVDQVWAAAQGVLREKLNPEIYGLWFANLSPRELTEEHFLLEVRDEFSGLWLRENYLPLLRDVVASATGRTLDIRFDVAAANPNRSETAPAAAAPAPAPEPEPEPASLPASQTGLGLNPNNTFDTFVVGSNNSFAHAACLAVAQSPGKAYNPLFIYGGTGLGKTHLLHAIAQHVHQHKRNPRIAYLSIEKFTNEYIDAIQTNQLIKFRKRYRHTDVLLIDDVQFLANKERTQEEFFHTFNALYDAHKQIVLTCDRPASEIQSLEHRLVSRFEWGLVTDLQPPDTETRTAILRKKEAQLGIKLPDEIIGFLAGRIRSNVRRLEGALVRIASYSTLIGKPLTVEVAEQQLRELLHEEGRFTLSVEVIQKRVAEHYDLRVADMTSKRRPENIAFPRQIAMYLARQLTASSLNVIGEAFGGRDHGTVLHACRLVKDRMEVDANVRQVVQYLEKQLQR